MQKFSWFLFGMLVLPFMVCAQVPSHSKYIIVDQFGYMPDAPKVAVIRDPQVGFDAAESFTPGNLFSLFSKDRNEVVFSAAPVAWNNGNTDASSGDKVWWFDFSAVTNPGTYYVLDTEHQVRSYEFRISPHVYKEVLKQAVRTFFYQRAGFAKEAPFAEAGWIDRASHIGPLQDKNARVYNASNNAATERDVSGGWYDAGDYNKYTSWTASYVVEFMLAYLENPEVWTDDYNIPESGNGIPDLLDEARWGLDHLIRMQNENGSVLSIVGMSHASPPSAASGPSRYGLASTAATLNTAAAFAISSGVFQAIGQTAYAEELKTRAISAYDWAAANPNVLFQNNSSSNNSGGLGAGQQEVDDYGRMTARLRAACFLFEVTGDEQYRQHFDGNYRNVNMFQWNFAFPFQADKQDMLLYYTKLENATPSVKNDIINVYRNAMLNGSENMPAVTNKKDPYMSHIKDYTWGSNSVQCRQGSMFYSMIAYNVSPAHNAQARKAAIGYVNYIHGVNPLNIVYLSNMYQYGAKNGVNEFYHTWFANGSAKWDRVGTSVYGPAPGFLTGGPNPGYDWDGCCPTGCGSSNNNALCLSESISPPKGQPNQKSYKDFNTSWPLNSWSVTENSCGYQISYIRLLSKFVDASPDDTSIREKPGNSDSGPVNIFPNPTNGMLYFTCTGNSSMQITVMDINGNKLHEARAEGNYSFDMGGMASGVYMAVVKHAEGVHSSKIVKL